MTEHPEDGPLSDAVRRGLDDDAILRRLLARVLRPGQPTTHNRRNPEPPTEAPPRGTNGQ